jgi:prevent-host-death family protein
MQQIPPILPISDLRVQAKEILKQANQQPVVITQHGRPSAVLISYQTYNEMVAQLLQLATYRQKERMVWSALSEEALQRVWDNPQDAAYDDWKVLSLETGGFEVPFCL